MSTSTSRTCMNLRRAARACPQSDACRSRCPGGRFGLSNVVLCSSPTRVAWRSDIRAVLGIGSRAGGQLTAGWQVPLYQAQHAPLWYHARGADLHLGGRHRRTGRPPLRRCGWRTFCFWCFATAAALITVRVLWRDHPLLPIVSLGIALSPMLFLNAVRASNDSLAVLLTAMAVLCLAIAMSGRVGWVVCCRITEWRCFLVQDDQCGADPLRRVHAW